MSPMNLRATASRTPRIARVLNLVQAARALPHAERLVPLIALKRGLHTDSGGPPVQLRLLDQAIAGAAERLAFPPRLVAQAVADLTLPVEAWWPACDPAPGRGERRATRTALEVAFGVARLAWDAVSERLTTTGMWRGAFVVPLDVPGVEDRLRLSRPLAQAAVETAIRNPARRAELASFVRGNLDRLREPDRQRVLARLARLAWVEGGLPAATVACHSPRYANAKAHAWAGVAHVAAAHGALDDAWRAIERTPRGLARQRAIIAAAEASGAGDSRIRRAILAVDQRGLAWRRQLCLVRLDLAGRRLKWAARRLALAPRVMSREEHWMTQLARLDLQLGQGAPEPRLLSSLQFAARASGARRDALLSTFDRWGQAPEYAPMALMEAVRAIPSLPWTVEDRVTLDGVQGAEPPADPALRCHYDEGRVLSLNPGAHRQAVLRACMRTLRAAAVDGEISSVGHVRLRTLVRLAGPDVVSRLQRLAIQSHPAPAFDDLFQAVLQLDPHAATGLVRDYVLTLPATRRDALLRAANGRAVAPGFGPAWVAAIHAASAWTEHPTAWLLRACPGPALPRNELLRLLARMTDAPDQPETVLSRAEAALEALGDTPQAVARALLRRPDLIEQWLALRPPRLPPKAPRRDGSWWHQRIQRLARDPRRVSRAPATHMEALLGLAAGTLDGRWPLAGDGVLDAGHGLQLRWLDPLRDLLSWFRFADASACCFATTSRLFSRHEVFIRALLLDPLSFVFLVEHAGTPAGFVFAQYGEFRGPAVIMNGIYVRTDRHASRVVRALDWGFIRPLGVATWGMANRRGVALQGFTTQQGQFRRHRALAYGARLVTDSYDDVDSCVNRWRPTSSHLVWRSTARRRPGR